MNRFSSKYDECLAGRARLTGEERKGLELFEGKAGCAGCHPNAGQRALLTDCTYDHIGVPANPANPRLKTDPLFRDLGIGGHFGQPNEYGKQKVATLRNLDRRPERGGVKSYMRSGVFKPLPQDVVRRLREPPAVAVQAKLSALSVLPVPRYCGRDG